MNFVRLTASDLVLLGLQSMKIILIQFWRNGIDVLFTNKAIKHGIKYEEIVTMIYSFRNNVEVFGRLYSTQTFSFWCFSWQIGIVIVLTRIILVDVEIKCPQRLLGFCPEYYWAQVQGQSMCVWISVILECLIEEYPNEDAYLDEGIGDF